MFWLRALSRSFCSYAVCFRRRLGMTLENLDLTQLVNVLVGIAPGAGILIVVAVCFKIMGERPSSLLQGLAAILWGWRRKNDSTDDR